MSKNPDDANRGLYKKFNVSRTDGGSAPGRKHEKCNYFVLDLTHDRFAPPAIQAYARACARDLPVLSAELLAKFPDRADGVDVPKLAAGIREVAQKLHDSNEEGCSTAKGAEISDQVELLRVLARMVEGKTIRAAFGAPGDWGYETLIGGALAGRS